MCTVGNYESSLQKRMTAFDAVGSKRREASRGVGVATASAWTSTPSPRPANIVRELHWLFWLNHPALEALIKHGLALVDAPHLHPRNSKMPWPQAGHSCSTVARVDFRLIVKLRPPGRPGGGWFAFVRVSRGSEALDSFKAHEAPQVEDTAGAPWPCISRKLPQWPQNKFPPMESTTRRLSVILCVKSSSWFCV